MPKPYLAIKETLVREYARRGGKLRRREARDLIKIDVNKTSRVWDYLHEAGLLKASLDENGAVVGTTEQRFVGAYMDLGVDSSIPIVHTQTHRTT